MNQKIDGKGTIDYSFKYFGKNRKKTNRMVIIY